MDTERIVKIIERNDQTCEVCGHPLKCNIAFTGLVWSPTASGTNHR